MQLASDSPSISAENAAQIMGGLGENDAPIPAKRMVRKYDRRGAANRLKAETQRKRKPFHEEHLSRNTAAKLFRGLNLYEKFAQLLSTEDERLRFEVMRYLWDRLEGKPFMAKNPAENKVPAWQDNRLQVAIQNLNIGQSGTKQLKGSKSQRNKGESLTIPPSKLLETKATSDNGNYVTVTTTDGASTSDDAGQPGQDGIAE